MENYSHGGEQALRKHADAHSDKKWAQLYLNSVGQDKMFDKTKSNWPINIEFVHAELKKGPLVVLMAQDPFNNMEEITTEQLMQITDNFVVLSGNAKYFLNPKKNICYIPYWYLTQKLSSSPIQATNSPRSFKISSLNGKSSYHRIENFIKLRERQYFSEILFTMHNNFNLEECEKTAPIEFWNINIINKFKLLLSSKELRYGYTNDHTIRHPAYTDSYINYITETSVRTSEIFCSEKTWKPFRSGQFGIWLSNPNYITFLRSIGLDVFDDVFGGHDYDREPNLNKRIDMIHNLIDNIISTDLTTIYQKTLSRRQANIDLFYSDTFENLLTSQCEDYQI